MVKIYDTFFKGVVLAAPFRDKSSLNPYIYIRVDFTPLSQKPPKRPLLANSMAVLPKGLPWSRPKKPLLGPLS